MFDISPHKEYIDARIAAGASLRMLETEIKVSRKTLSSAMKRAGLKVPTKDESISHIWKNHKHPLLGKKGKECHMYGRRMPEATKQKLREANTAERNYHWSGGRKMHSEGYVLVYLPGHHLANKHGFALEHRVVAEQKYGMNLKTGDIVHHIDGNKTNNDPENIVVLSRSEHAKIHDNLNKDNGR